MSPILLHLQYERGILILDGNRNHIKLICVCVCVFPHFSCKLQDNYTFILMTIGWFKFPDVKTNLITLIFSRCKTNLIMDVRSGNLTLSR